MKVAVIGLGKMGYAIADRLRQSGHTVYGFDVDYNMHKKAQQLGIHTVDSIQELSAVADIFWLMVPIGDPADQLISALQNNMRSGSIIIDGGNSKFTDSQRRAYDLAKKDIYYLDCGTSGGLKGHDIGFSLMVGGDKKAYDVVIPLLQAIAAPNGYGYVGPSGAGHYVKMVHNGIEYALMQAYAEGFQLIKQGSFKEHDLDLEAVTHIWQNGSVIRSWLLDLSHEIFETDQQFTTISGELAEGGTGKWTVEDAHKNNISIPTIEDALKVRSWSRETGGNYATKIIALLRNKFGGHAVKKEDA